MNRHWDKAATPIRLKKEAAAAKHNSSYHIKNEVSQKVEPEKEVRYVNGIREAEFEEKK